jgi:hypothetical protein
MTMPIGSAEHSLAHELVHALGWTLLHFCWQGALVALVLWCVLGLLAGRSSQVRYGAACFALALLVAMPLVTFAHIASVEYRMRASDADSAIVIDPGMLRPLDAVAAGGVVCGRNLLCGAAELRADGSAKAETREH